MIPNGLRQAIYTESYLPGIPRNGEQQLSRAFVGWSLVCSLQQSLSRREEFFS